MYCAGSNAFIGKNVKSQRSTFQRCELGTRATAVACRSNLEQLRAILEAVRPSLRSTLVRYSATTYSGVPHPPTPNRHAERPVLKSISSSLLRGYGIPSTYTRLIGCDRHAHITLLQNVCLLATHIQAVGGHPLQWEAASSGSSTTPGLLPPE